ncbi:MAG: cupin domain-containing protein [Rhodospirillaceae bacterium]|nr:cupin domain-containing protein [Rhodospirillaceae bacterium]
MPKPVHIATELARLSVLRDRRPDTPEEEAEKAFATLADFGNGAIFAGSFAGSSAWERHDHGDELVQILAGETTLTILAHDGDQELHLSAGMLTVVPQGCWHRFHAPDGVPVLTATPQPTVHSTTDPRDRR